MRSIEFTHPHRQKHFEFFRKMEIPHYSIVAPVAVDPLVAFIKDNNLHFTGTIVYLIAYVANAIPEFRWRIRGDQVIEHPVVHPSYTVSTSDTDVFSFCFVEYTDTYAQFVSRLQHAQQEMLHSPSLEDEAGRDDYLFLSAMPWVHFTGFSHPMHAPPRDSVPRFVWGKIEERNGVQLMPLGLQVHHGVVDGKHAGMYYERFDEYCKNPESVIKLNPS